MTIMPEVVEAYKKYAGFVEGDWYRLFVRTAGPGTGGLFYALEKGDAQEANEEDTVITIGGVTFFIKPGDAWYFDGGTLSYNDKLGEFGFTFENHSLEQ